jgi:hypothetical protein
MAFCKLEGLILLGRDGDLNLDTGLQTDARLMYTLDLLADGAIERKAHNLFDDLARGVQINKALVDFEFITVPGLGTLTARLGRRGGGEGKRHVGTRRL